MRLLVLLLLLPALTGFGPPALIESDAARAPVTAAVVERLGRGRAPQVGARAGLLVDARSGEAVWEREPDRRLAVASITKVMTALLAVERGRLDAPVRVQVGAAQLPGHSVAGLRAGEQLPLGEALYGLMLPSGNDAALAIAGSLSGSTEAFVAQMNRRAEELGLKNTRFANPHGFDAPEHFSSARDVVLLARLLLRQPVLAEIVATREHTYRGQFVHSWTNGNRLLWLRPDATGVKTGTTDAAGASLVGSARRGDREALVVVLNSPDRWGEADALLDHFFLDHAPVTVGLPPSPFYRGLAQPAARATTVPVWQVGLTSARLLPREEGGFAFDFELAGRQLASAVVRQ